jgi:hypothetical protein
MVLAALALSRQNHGIALFFQSRRIQFEHVLPKAGKAGAHSSLCQGKKCSSLFSCSFLFLFSSLFLFSLI